MKLVRLLGTRSKSDFAIYIAHVIATMGKRVLIVDATNNNEYKYSYIREHENENLYDLQNIEILINTKTWNCVENKLKESNEKVENFDCIIVDCDGIETISGDWPKFNKTLYVSDDDRYNIQRDVEILHYYADVTEEDSIPRIHFESAFKVPEGYIDLLMNNRLHFIHLSEPIEHDELLPSLKNIMQHEYQIPYNRLTKQYKQALNDIVTNWFEIGYADIKDSLKKNPLGKIFKGLRPATHYEPNKKKSLNEGQAIGTVNIQLESEISQEKKGISEFN